MSELNSCRERIAMASSAEYLEYVLDLLRDVPVVTHKKMMGEYLLYSDGVLFGGVYDDRLLLKDTPAARAVFSEDQTPYDGAKPMLLADVDDRQLLMELIEKIHAELPEPKKRK